MELIDGMIVDMSPQKSAHATAICLIGEVLRGSIGSGHTLRIRMPLALDDASEPEPDVAVVPGKARDYAKAHPTTATLVVEVADTTLGLDRNTEGALYARNGIPEYWLVNLGDNCLEVYRDLREGQYRFQAVLRHGDTVRPQARPDHAIAVATCCPRTARYPPVRTRSAPPAGCA